MATIWIVIEIFIGTYWVGDIVYPEVIDAHAKSGVHFQSQGECEMHLFVLLDTSPYNDWIMTTDNRQGEIHKTLSRNTFPIKQLRCVPIVLK
jgi:hypothetical protein